MTKGGVYSPTIYPFMARGQILTGEYLEVVDVVGDTAVCVGHGRPTTHGAGLGFDLFGICMQHVLDGEMGEAAAQGFVYLSDEVADYE